MYYEKDFDTKKVIFIQILESPIPLPLLLLLCQKVVGCRYPRGIKSFKTYYKGMKNAFLRPLTMRQNVF